MVALRGQGTWRWEGPLGTPLGLVPAKQEPHVWSLGQEDPLEKEMATHSSILAWEIPWAKDPWGAKSWTQFSN